MDNKKLETLRTKYGQGVISIQSLTDTLNGHIEQAVEQVQIHSSSDNLSGAQKERFLEGSRKVGETAIHKAEALMEVMLIHGLISSDEFSTQKKKIDPLSYKLLTGDHE